MKYIQAGESIASRRRVYFQLVGTDGITPATGESNGQPQISSDGATWTNTGIGTLTHVGNGRYYADLTSATVMTVGVHVETRYKSGNTAECPGDTVLVVNYDPYNMIDASTPDLADTESTVPQSLEDPILVTIGDTYASALGNALEFTQTTEISFTSARMIIYNDMIEDHGIYDEVDADLVTTDSGYRILVDLSETVTSGLTRRNHRIEIIFTNAAGDVSLIRGFIKAQQ